MNEKKSGAYPDPLVALSKETVDRREREWDQYRGEPVQMRHGFFLRLRAQCDYSRRRYVFRVAEPMEFEYLLRGFRDELRGSICVDAGANVGYWTKALVEVFQVRHVYAFEPDPETYSILSANVHGSDAVTPIPVALGARKSDRLLFVDPTDTGDSTLSVVAGRVEILVSVVRLDDFVLEASISRLDFVKLDIQGGESAFFEGAQESLRRFRPLMLVEVMTDIETVITGTLANFAEDQGYAIFVVSPDQLLELSPQSIRSFQGNSNVFLIPRERVPAEWVDDD